MAKQTFTTGQVLTAAQMTSLQNTAMGGGAASTKTVSYVLVAADAGTTVAMNAAGSTTITVNSGLFSAGDTVFIQNIGAGACTITAGTATVSTAGSLILPQYDAGILYFTSSSAAIFYDYIQVGATSPLTTKGDLYTYSTSDTRLGVGSNGTVLTADSAEATGLKWATPSTGVVTYTERTDFNGDAINAIAFNGSNLYVAVANNGKLYSSPDGTTWTSRTSGFGSNGIRGLAFGNGVWVAVGENGTITSSTDGTTWTARTSGVSTNSLNAVAYLNNSLFVAVGAGANGGTGGITTSTDGTTWTKRTTPTTSSTTLYSVAYGNGEYCAVGDINTRAGYTSTDGATWVVAPASLSTNGYAVFYTNSLFYQFGSAGVRTATTASGTWTGRAGYSISTGNTVSSSTHYAVAVYNGEFYTLPQSQNYVVQQPVALNSVSRAQTGTKVNFVGMIYPGGTATNFPLAICVNSSGGVVVGTDLGRILTTF